MLKISRCPQDLWHQLSLHDQSCTFFQTPAWHTIAADYHGADSHPFLFEEEQTRVVLPMLKTKKGMFDYYFSPLGTYTSFLSSGPLSSAQTDEIRNFLLTKNIQLFSSPFAFLKIPLSQSEENATHIIRLDSLDPENIQKTWKKGHKDNLRMGLKKGDTVREASSLEDLELYFEIYQDAVIRWGSKAHVSYPFSLFEQIWKLCIAQQKAILWLVEWQGEIICGCIAFYHNRHVVAWNGAAKAEHWRQYANQVMYYHIILHARQKGFGIFDFNPSSNLEGVEKFKEGFGTEKLVFDSLRHHTPLYRTATWIKHLFLSS
jgi:lipid II:glycine glycyltransferase (peptidoglycan interpeptide bridge formation enzyme)